MSTPVRRAPAPSPEPTRPGELLDFLPDAYLETDPDGRIRQANVVLSGLIGYARGYAAGKPVEVLFMPEARDAVREQAIRAGREVQPRAFDSALRPRRDGPPRPVRVRLAAIRDDAGVPVGLRWLIRDVTEERRAAARLAAAEARHAAELRTRTMELEMTVRLLRAQLGHPPIPAADPGAYHQG